MRSNGYTELIQQQFGSKYVNPQIKGEGAFSTVFKCQNQQGKFFAIKVVNLIDAKPMVIPYLKNEVQLLKQSENDNVIKLYESLETKSALFLVLEYCEMDLKSMMATYFQNKLPENLVIIILKQLVNGLHYLHKNNIIHRDLKLENIGVVIKGENQNSLKERNKQQQLDIFLTASYKLLDLGLAKKFIDQTTTVTFAGTEVNMAPEVLQRKPYSFQADIYSLGVCLYQMVTGEYPYYDGLMRKQQFELIQQQNAKFKTIQNESLREIISSMLKYNVEDRLTFQQLYKTPLLYNFIENIQSNVEKSLIKNSEFYILEKTFVQEQQQQFNEEFFSIQESNPFQTQIIREQESNNEFKTIISYQDQFFQKIQSNAQNQFEIIEQKSTLYKSQIGKPKSKPKSQLEIQQSTQVEKWNNTRNQCILVQKVCYKLFDLIQSIPSILNYYSFQAEFQTYLEYFSSLFDKMKNELQQEVNYNQEIYPDNQEIKQFKDLLLNLQEYNYEGSINNIKSSTIYEVRKILKLIKQLQKVEVVNKAQNQLIENNELVYVQILRILQDTYYKENKLIHQNIDLKQFNCKIYSILISLALLSAVYENKCILVDDQIDELKEMDSQNDPDKLCCQLMEILDKYRLSFSYLDLKK